MLKPITPQFVVPSRVSGAGAAVPIGSVSSTKLFDLNGALFPTPAVPGCPAAAGDIIATHSSPGAAVFLDGSPAAVAENSKTSIEDIQ
jgi:hypothetical protein